MTGSSWLSPGSSIRFGLLLEFLAVQTGVGFHALLELVAGAEGHDPAGRDRNLFAGLGIPARARILLAQAKVAKTGEFHLMTIGQGKAEFVEKQLNKLLGLPFIEAKLIKQ